MVAGLEAERADSTALVDDCHSSLPPFRLGLTPQCYLLRHQCVDGGCFRVRPALVHH